MRVEVANAEDHGEKDNCCCTPSAHDQWLYPSVARGLGAGRVGPDGHSQRRTEALYSRYSEPNRPVRYCSSRGTTTRVMMATVAINVVISHRLLTQIARPRCNVKNAK